MCKQRLSEHLTGTVGGSSSGRVLKGMNIMYILILKLYEPDLIMIHDFIKLQKSRLSRAVLGKTKLFSVCFIHSYLFCSSATVPIFPGIRVIRFAI